MKFRTLLILCVMLVLLAGLLLVTRVSENGSGGVHREVLIPLSPDQVTRIEIASPSGELTLTRVDGKWRVTAPADLPADLARVTYALNGLAGMTSRGVISTNPDKAGQFEVDEEHATRVSLFAGKEKPAAIVYLGKGATSLLDSYARMEGSDTVHEVQGFLRDSLRADPQHWRDRAVVQFDPSSIVRVAFSGASDLALERDADGPWRWVGGASPDRAPDPAKVTRVLDSINAMRAATFVDEPPQEDTAPLMRIALTPSGAAEPLVLIVEAEEKGGRYRVRSAASDQRVVVPGGVLTGLLADPVAQLAAAAPSTADASAAADAPAVGTQP